MPRWRMAKPTSDRRLAWFAASRSRLGCDSGWHGRARSWRHSKRDCRQRYRGTDRSVDSEERISAMLDTANRRPFEAMYAVGGRPGMGTTVVGAVLLDQEAIVFNVGDSRAHALREDGQPRAIPLGKGVLAQIASIPQVQPS